MCLLLTALATAPVSAQQGRLRGLVTDSSGTPIKDATVGIVALRQLVRTDDRGAFSIDNLPRGEHQLSVRHLGYDPQDVVVAVSAVLVDSVRFVLVPRPAVLDAIAVSSTERMRRQGIEEFYQRRTRGVGTYFTHDEIVARRPRVPSDVLRTTPGLSVSRGRVRFGNTTSITRRDCMPMIWVDGQRAPGLEVDELNVHDIEGIELYSGPSTTPMQFSPSSSMFSCGTIVVWTRPPG